MLLIRQQQLHKMMKHIISAVAAATVATAIDSSFLSICMTKMNKCDGHKNLGDHISINFGNENIRASYLQSKPSGQDFVTIVKGISHGEEYTGLIVIDGHGSSDVINMLRELDYREILESDNLLEEINKYICDKMYSDDPQHTLNSGAVVSIVQIFKDRYVMKWMGDCKIHIRANGKIIATSHNHNYLEHSLIPSPPVNNEHNYCKKPIIKDDYTLSVIDDKSITMKPSKRFYYPYRDMNALSFTRSLGHCQLIGNDLGFETRTIPRNSCFKEDIVVYSDGIGDMICEKDFHNILSNNTCDTIDFCDKRWKQEWIYEYEGVKEVTSLSKTDQDDMCIAQWSNHS